MRKTRKTYAKHAQNLSQTRKTFQNLPKPFPKLFPIAANPFSRYLAALAAKYMEKRPKNRQKIAFLLGNALKEGFQKFQNGFVDHPSPIFVTTPPFLRYLAPLGAKYLEKMSKKYKQSTKN